MRAPLLPLNYKEGTSGAPGLASGATMPSLTFSPDCESCLRQEQRIKELEVRVSLLRGIREDEDFLDTFVAAASGLASILQDSMSPGLPKEPPAADLPFGGGIITLKDWPNLGAIPKRPETGAAASSDDFIPVHRSKQKRCRNVSRAASPGAKRFAPLAI